MPLGWTDAPVVGGVELARRAQRADAHRQAALAAAEVVDAIDLAEREQALRDHEDARGRRIDHQRLGVGRPVGVAEGQDGRHQRCVGEPCRLLHLEDLHAAAPAAVVADVAQVDAAAVGARRARSDGDVLGVAQRGAAQRERGGDGPVGAQRIQRQHVAGVVVGPEDAGVDLARREARQLVQHRGHGARALRARDILRARPGRRVARVPGRRRPEDDEDGEDAARHARAD